jgi:hypothetical protein
MERRRFLKSVVTAGGALACRGATASFAQAATGVSGEALAVNRVLTVFKCHLDVGFVDTQANVLRRYFKEYFPRAIEICAESRLPRKQRYRWTTGSWLLYEYLEQASPEERKRMDAAIAADDICWHALPFNWQTELMDRSQIAASLALSKSLDRRYGKTTTGAKMTDVPGHTRGLVRPLVEGGVTFLDIGVNGASRPAELPPLFLWKNGRGDALTVMYHHNYGAVAQVPGTDLAIAIVVRHDNSGPHNWNEIDEIYADLAHQFPNATVSASSLTDVARAIQPYENKLPVVTQEMGDTWIYGVPSDPLKMARYREISRLRQRWIASGELGEGDATDVTLLRQLLLEAEHTWGTDTKVWLDFDHYKPDDLVGMLPTPKYEVVQASWREKRQDLYAGIATLPPKLRTEAEGALAALVPIEHAFPHHKLSAAELKLETSHLILQVDPANGAITRFRRKGSDREWASRDHPLALISYQTLSPKDFTGFFAKYIIKEADWVSKDFGKPNIEHFGAVSKTWYPSVQRSRRISTTDGQRLLLELRIEAPEALEAGYASFPEKIYVEVFAPRDQAEVHLNVSWFRKRATRLPEALWLTFQPQTAASSKWSLDKCGEEISPFDVADSGGRHMHAVSTGFSCAEEGDRLRIDTLDAPVLALGERSPLNFSRNQPNLEAGIHCNLFNNAWGTNYVQWFGEDMRFRFVLSA